MSQSQSVLCECDAIVFNNNVSSQSVLYECDAMIQLMHSFEVNIRICQPKNSDVHQGEAEVNITFEG